MDANGLQDFSSDLSSDAAKLGKHIVCFFIPVDRQKMGGGLHVGIHVFQRNKDTAEETHAEGDSIDNAGQHVLIGCDDADQIGNAQRNKEHG